MVKIYSISTIKKKVRELGKKINAPSHLLSVRTTSDGFGTPYIEINKNGYDYVVSERGVEYKREQTNDISVLLYWIFKSIVFSMVSGYELNNRNPNEDSRRKLFAKILELMEQLDPKFFEWEKKDLDSILKENPYEDKKM